MGRCVCAQRTVEASLGWSRVCERERPGVGVRETWGSTPAGLRSIEGTEDPWQGFEPSRDKVYSC